MQNMDKSIIQVSKQVVADSNVLIKKNKDSISLTRTMFTGLKSLSFSTNPDFSNYLESLLQKQSSDLVLNHKLSSSLSSISSEIPFKKENHAKLEEKHLLKLYKDDIEDFESRVFILQETLIDLIEEFEENGSF